MAENNEEATILRMHDLRPAPGANKDRIRVGRGEGSKGKTSGRGTKGTKARYQVRPGFEGGQLPLYMRLPKLRGFKSPFKKQFQVVNVATLAELFPQGGEVTVEDLVAKGAVRKGFPVKVLGDGETTVAFTLKGVKASASAKTKIEAAGGSISEE
ncbi:50S ribosomal protein L15 [Bifidobacterium margollesii]|uniref:Large ribosomal subunit protein uL15 n=1 Tax=Bifidobacterium margollesii TaxID=2020964 RepID=A0A2N5JCY9_9BIFI|nr:50S ribosomal protein L15 [Bifidobacterium margollesii]PLS32090.1 50S ribosomal protein L15 [Bifidobacterium margollesii]